MPEGPEVETESLREKIHEGAEREGGLLKAIALSTALRRLLDDPLAAAELGRRARARCQEHYSFTAARAALFPLVERAAAAR